MQRQGAPEQTDPGASAIKTLTPDTYVEKTLLYLVAFSILLHAAVVAFIAYLPQDRDTPRQEPYMVELQDLPPVVQKPRQEEKEVPRLHEERRRVPREIAPRGERERDKPAAVPSAEAPPAARQPATTPPTPRLPAAREDAPPRERASSDFFRPKEQTLPDMASLLPTEKLAKLEEGYRKKYGAEVEEGEARFLNTDDIQFGSFLRRFESAVYGVWRYPADAARLGIEGITPVRITFNRKGEIEKMELLETSGSKLLDDEVRRTLRMVGAVGGFPKGYDKEQFKLLAFFHYGIVKGKIRGSLH